LKLEIRNLKLENENWKLAKDAAVIPLRRISIFEFPFRQSAMETCSSVAANSRAVWISPAGGHNHDG
jgi:hypothetical protein